MADTILVYVGTYTFRKSKGIYVFQLDPSTGDLKPTSKATGIQNPSFLAINPQQKYLYAVNETADFEGKHSGAVSAFSIDQETGELSLLNSKPSLGLHPCYVCVNKTGKFVLVANYSSGNVSVLPVKRDGSLGDAADFVQHHGSGVDLKRQEGPHAHSVTLDEANRYAFVADLGLDKIMVYRFDSNLGKLMPNDEPWTKIHSGAGPRHFAFHPNSKYAYLINELDSTITAFNYEAEHGTLKEMQTVPALPKGFKGTSHCADIHVAPSGKFLYGSNRGHNSIVIYFIDETTGKLAYVGHEQTQGKTPRNFAIDLAGNLLLVANQDTDTIVPFKINQQTGQLAATGKVTKVPMPVCLKMMRIS
jgi:6-phosphogluconolactonase